MLRDRAYGHTHFPDDLGVQRGAVSISTAANAVKSVRVNFVTKHNTYAAAPIVTATARSSTPNSGISVTVNGVTADYFSIYVYNTKAEDVFINWIAVGEVNL